MMPQLRTQAPGPDRGPCTFLLSSTRNTSSMSMHVMRAITVWQTFLGGLAKKKGRGRLAEPARSDSPERPRAISWRQRPLAICVSRQRPVDVALDRGAQARFSTYNNAYHPPDGRAPVLN